MPALNQIAETLLSETAISDLSSVAETELYVVPTGYRCILTKAYLVANADVGGALECSIGQNGAETDFVGTTNGDNLDAQYDCIVMQPVPSATPSTNKSYAAATSIRFDVSVAGNAVAGTVFLFGFLYD